MSIVSFGGYAMGSTSNSSNQAITVNMAGPSNAPDLPWDLATVTSIYFRGDFSGSSEYTDTTINNVTTRVGQNNDNGDTAVWTSQALSTAINVLPILSNTGTFTMYVSPSSAVNYAPQGMSNWWEHFLWFNARSGSSDPTFTALSLSAPSSWNTPEWVDPPNTLSWFSGITYSITASNVSDLTYSWTVSAVGSGNLDNFYHWLGTSNVTNGMSAWTAAANRSTVGNSRGGGTYYYAVKGIMGHEQEQFQISVSVSSSSASVTRTANVTVTVNHPQPNVGNLPASVLTNLEGNLVQPGGPGSLIVPRTSWDGAMKWGLDDHHQ